MAWSCTGDRGQPEGMPWVWWVQLSLVVTVLLSPNMMMFWHGNVFLISGPLCGSQLSPNVIMSWHWIVSTLLALCEENPPVTGGFPSQMASNVYSFYIFLVVSRKKLLNKQSSPLDDFRCSQWQKFYQYANISVHGMIHTILNISVYWYDGYTSVGARASANTVLTISGFYSGYPYTIHNTPYFTPSAKQNIAQTMDHSHSAWASYGVSIVCTVKPLI